MAMWRGLAIMAVLGTAQTAQATKLAILPLGSNRIAKETVRVLDDLLTAQLYERGGYELVTGADINATLGLEKMKDALGCADTACAAEIGGALGVDLLLSGTVGELA